MSQKGAPVPGPVAQCLPSRGQRFTGGSSFFVMIDADLQIGKLMWGDSGLYYCIITTPDDLEGKNEDSVELLVLGEWKPGAAFSP